MSKIIHHEPRPLGDTYDPSGFEKAIYAFWEKNGAFQASDDLKPGQKSFCIMMPPPNVTGVLHLGHALTGTIEDILTRWRRMCGDQALWLPGTDHAGISTQAQVEKALAKEKGPSGRSLSRHDLGRKAFLERTWKWKEDHGNIIVSQIRRLGSSVDWSRERFTLDPGFTRAVLHVFTKLYEQGLIYRGERIINWCTRCHTALSDLEVIPNERKGNLWKIRYFFANAKGEKTGDSIEIATTRPETLLGDTAVAVHPDDDRYKAHHGKQLILPLLGRKIPLITDGSVDMEFGTGGLKVTPAHDFNDYEMGTRHKLPFIQVMGKDGKITDEGGPYRGLKFTEAREKILQDLKDQGHFISVADHAMSVGLCQRCDTVAEPIISKQWFVKIKPLAEPAIKAVESGEIEFRPKNWEKTYFEWMRNIRDWCISRQLWWGHQIPAYYCSKCEGVTVAVDKPETCSQCKASGTLTQDEDVLDTWFSSGLWPFVTLGWPEQTKAFKTFYPTTILETGFDILFFWVARMIMLGMHFTGKPPFQKVYLHAMVRDEKGEKMSKSKGNVIDPIEIIDKLGADPLRFTLAIMAGQGQDIKLSMSRVEGYRSFCNKIWNSMKFFHLQWEKHKPEIPHEGIEAWVKANHSGLDPISKWILSSFERHSEKVRQGLENFELNVSSQAIYDFIWHEFCDWFIELSKISLADHASNPNHTLYVMHFVLDQTMRLAHPFIPFVTEELWNSLPDRKAALHSSTGVQLMTLTLQPYPKPTGFSDPKSEAMMNQIQSVVQSVRVFRGENKVPPNKKIAMDCATSTEAVQKFIETHLEAITLLAKIEKLNFVKPTQPPTKTQSIVGVSDPKLEFRIEVGQFIDPEEEKKRIQKETEKTQTELERIRAKLSNAGFRDRAPKEVVDGEIAKQQELERKLQDLTTAAKRIGNL